MPNTKPPKPRYSVSGEWLPRKGEWVVCHLPDGDRPGVIIETVPIDSVASFLFSRPCKVAIQGGENPHRLTVKEMSPWPSNPSNTQHMPRIEAGQGE